MRKIAILILSLLISSVFLSYAAPVFAAEDDPATLKIYYSESLGTGERVMHVTVCNKVRVYAPLTCTKELVDKQIDGWQQCDEASDVGKMIKGCLIPQGDGYIQIEGTAYNYSDPILYNKKAEEQPNGCADKPELQAPIYAKQVAIVPDTMDFEDMDEAKIEEELATYVDEDGTPVATIPAGKAVRLTYKPALCAVYDKPIGGGANQVDPRHQELLRKIGSYDETMMEDPNSCNNTQHQSVLDQEPMVTCSVMERITGNSGTEIFSKYVRGIYTWAAGVVGIIAVFTMVYSGIQISMSADGGSIDEAKNRIMKSIIGLVILFLSGLILYTINPTFFTGG